MANLSNTDIIKGSKLMVFIEGQPVGMATSHSLSMTLNTTEVSTKDHGDFKAIVPQDISWELSAENLYTNAGKKTYMDAMSNMTKVTVQFVNTNYNNTKERGILDNQSSSGYQSTSTAEPIGSAENWTVGIQGPQGPQAIPVGGEVIAEGQAYITSFNINAAAGDNATMSVTFTGVGALTTA